MDNYSYIETKVEKTINALEGIQTAEPTPYFYSRLHARMERELLTPKKVLGWQFKPIYALSVVLIILIINILTIFNLQKTKMPDQELYTFYESGVF